METNNEFEKKLSNEVVKAIGKTIFDYYGKLAEINDKDIIKLSNLLMHYYPLQAEEKKALNDLEEWLLVKEINEVSQKELVKLNDLIDSGVKKWADFMSSWKRDWEYQIERDQRERREREMYHKERYHEERYHKEGHPEMLYKELQYLMKSGDAQSMIDVIYKIVDSINSNQINRTVLSIPNISPPEIKIPSEIIKENREIATETQKTLNQFQKLVPLARRCLSEYIFKIVKSEQIKYQKD